jgi:hypothetical protein
MRSAAEKRADAAGLSRITLAGLKTRHYIGRQAPVKRNICLIERTSLGLTSVSFLSFRMRPCFFVPVKWRLPECMRTILPVAVILKRLAAPRCVLSFFFGFVEFLGITKILSYSTAGKPANRVYTDSTGA